MQWVCVSCCVVVQRGCRVCVVLCEISVECCTEPPWREAGPLLCGVEKTAVVWWEVSSVWRSSETPKPQRSEPRPVLWHVALTRGLG